VASIASRFEEHTKLLSGASDLLGSAQSHLVSTLDERQSALEELAVGLVKKSEEIERTMKSFDNLVGSALEKAEDRTKQSTEHIREAMSEVIESATRRFADATEEIRRTAGSIRSDLEETRAELRKGVLDMPVEAKESTSAIRRAVAEQINALKELSDIVAKTGRTVDIPDEPRPQRPAPQAAPRAAAPSPRPAAQRAQERAPQRAPEPPRAQEPKREPQPRPLEVAAAEARQEKRPPQPKPAAPQAPSPVLRGTLALDAEAPQTPRAPETPAQSGEAGGWVRDLLREASRDEAAPAKRPAPAAKPSQPQRSPLHVVESLNSLSVDIARAIDHDISIELWDRYRRGERDVFTRRLYTLKGQQTFDDIRRKYQSDSEFRLAVDRYCEDFEKLLKDVARSDRDNIMTQTYLTSDTGKTDKGREQSRPFAFSR
jgi:hypothetical protein